MDGSADATKKTKNHFLTPKTEEPHTYLEASVKGGAFFTHVEVEINGNKVDQDYQGAHGYLYAAFNKTFCSTKLLLDKYGKTFPRISREVDRKHLANEQSADLIESYEETTEHDGPRASAQLLLRWTWDGIFPFDFQNNQLRTLSGLVNENGFLPPGIDLLIRAYKRTSLSECFQRTAVADTAYFAETPATKQEEIDVTLKDFTISYESLTLSTQERMDLAAGLFLLH